MNSTESLFTPRGGARHFADAPGARDYIVALGRVYLDVGLPLAAAFEAALADYQSLGVPRECDQ